MHLYLVAFVLFALYKVLDRLVRIFYLGKYDQRYVLITGCDCGFGNMLAKRLDSKGCHVFAACLTDKGQQELKKQTSSRLVTLSMDVTKTESIHKALEYVKSKLPPGKGLWGLVNNAGLMGYMGPPEWQTMKEYNLVCNVNTFGLIDVTMSFLPLLKQEKGRIVSTASVVGRISLADCAPYCLSKHGVEAFMDALRRSLYEYGVKCSIIEPGAHGSQFWDKSDQKDEILHVLVKDWDQLPAAVQEEFGEEYYKYESTAMIDVFRKIASPRLTDVVDAYEHGLFARFPRGRYVVGPDAKLLWIPLTYIPEWLSDWVLRQCQPHRPLPAMLKKKKAM